MTDATLREAALASRAWPFEEARKLVKRYEKTPPEKGHVLFETGYGPSGLPHIGTFGEVARTTMVRRAFETISDIPTRLIVFSDDMDGMRKVPDNVPNQALLREHLQQPLTSVPDPFGTHESFGHHNNARLRAFLDHFGFDYEFASATDYYRSGRMDEVLLRAAERYDAIMEVMLASLREERQKTYSCFLPISPTTGRVLYVPMKEVNGREGTITFDDEDGTEVTLPVTGGRVKLQWKPDFGARWAALDVDFEMYGKDHQPNTPIYDGICRILGGTPPEHFVYEMFLDGEGQKISKSKGNGLSIDEWLSYASPESLQLFMFQKPRSAKRLHWDVIPRAVDEYHQHLRAYPGQPVEAAAEQPRLAHPWAQHAGQRHGGAVLHAAEPGLGGLGGGQGGALGLPAPLCAGCDAREPSGARRRLRACRAVFPGPCEADQALPGADRDRARRIGGFARPPCGLGRRQRSRGAAGGRLRGRPCAWLREPARLVPDDLRGAAGLGAGAALRRLHRALWRAGDRRVDRPRAGWPARRLNGKAPLRWAKGRLGCAAALSPISSSRFSSSRSARTRRRPTRHARA